MTDIIQAAVQPAVQSLIREKKHIALFPGGAARLANEDCASETSVLRMWDTYGQAVGIARRLAKPDSSCPAKDAVRPLEESACVALKHG